MATNVTSNDHYCRILVQGLRRIHEDEFAHFCIERGAQGVAEELKFSQPEMVYEAQVITTDRFDLNVYFEQHPGEAFLQDLKSEFPEVGLDVRAEPNQDWMENWKKGFEPFLFVEPFWIVPSWREVPEEAKEVLFVDPGMAFGTGTHETTKLCARHIVDHWPKIVAKAKTSVNSNSNSNATSNPGPSVLDVGTGTGVLALIARRLGAGEVTAIDNDPEARRVARENLRLNNAEQIRVPEDQLGDIRGQYDLVVANIIDGILLKLKEDLLKVLKPGGTLILSGILTEREGPFLEEILQNTGLRNRRRRTMGEWSSFLIQ